MKLFAILFVVLLTACGGGGGGGSSSPGGEVPTPTPPSAPQSLDRYLPMFMGGQRLKGIIQKIDGEPYTEWRAENNKIWWSLTDTEYFDVRDCKGKRWSWLLGFGNEEAHQFYALQNTKTTLNGVELDCPQSGSPYQPFDKPIDFQDEVEQWGKILVQGGEPILYYWKALFSYGQVAENPCWVGNGPKTRSVIVQREVWWDSKGGWVRGWENKLPWVDGEPQAVAPFMEWEVKNAEDGGLLWMAKDSKIQLCLRDIVSW